MPYPPNTPLGRFGVDTVTADPHRCVGTIPAGGMVNPLTGTPTLAVLAMLVDHVAGLVNHIRRAPSEWTVTSELALELTPDAMRHIAEAPDEPVFATGRPFGPRTDTALSRCELTHRDILVGTATVRSFYIDAPDEHIAYPAAPPDATPPTDLADMMAVRAGTADDGSQLLHQHPDPVLNNTLGIVHGGVSAAALELVAAAAVNAGRADEPLDTASLRINFLRRLHTGPDSHYRGTAVRIGRRSALSKAEAIDTDGRAAILARLTAYC
ncbi:PaaI family thioesterase [Mycolicibacterium thermoresistibile]